MTEPLDERWAFTITWDPAKGPLPHPMLMLFRGTPKGGIRPGRATRITDRGHATHYVKAVRDYVAKYRADRTDITATAEPAETAENVPALSDTTPREGIR